MFDLKFAEQNPPAAGVVGVTQKWADMIAERSEGRVKITLYPAGSLAKMPEVYRAVETGVADVTWYNVGWPPGLQELNSVFSLPFMGITSMRMGTDVFRELYNKFPEMRAQWDGVKPMGFRMQPPSQMHFVKKDVRVPDDIKGMKVGASWFWVDVVDNAGGAPVGVNIQDVYISLERGLIEGWIIFFPAIYVLGCLPLLPHHTVFGEGGASESTDLYLWNLDTWNSLPPDIQKIIEDATEWRTEEILNFDLGEIKAAENAGKEANHTFTNVTPEEIQLWAEIAQPVHDKWIADREAEGLPGKAVYEEARRLVAEYSK